MDFSIKDPKERCKVCQELIDSGSNISLEKMADYILFADSQKQKRELLTANRMVTINKRETSWLPDQTLYPQITEDPDVIFRPTVSITKKDLDTIPFLPQIAEAVGILKGKEVAASGIDKYKIKKAIIELRQDQYVIKNAYLKPITFSGAVAAGFPRLFPEEITNVDLAQPHFSGFSFLDEAFVRLCLINYSKLKQAGYGNFQSDTWFMMEDLDKLCEKALKNDERLKLILILKIDGKQNSYIREQLQLKFGLNHTPGYISTLWRHKIPKMIAKQAELDYLEWYFTFVEKGKWKRCSKCGCVRLASPAFFTRSSSTKDGLYSICKECRRRKKDGS